MPYQLRKDKNLCYFGGYGVRIELHSMANSSRVFWSPHSNSYVCVQRDNGRYAIYSINGIGEIRWGGHPGECGLSGDADAQLAIDYFLEWVGEPAIDQLLNTLKDPRRI